MALALAQQEGEATADVSGAVWLPWVRAAQRGDRAAFGLLHGHFKGLVHAILIAKVPPADAADLTQDVFLQMMARVASLDQVQAFPSWLIALSRNRAARHLRDRPTAEVATVEEPAAPDRSGAPDVRRVLRALKALPETYAETLAMRLIEGLSGPEIAERTGLTAGSVRVNLHRGMKLLRESLGLAPEEIGHE